MKIFFWTFKKELMSMVRDKRTFFSLLLPLLIFPLMYYAMGIQYRKMEDNLSEQIYLYSNVQQDEEKREFLTSVLLNDIPVAFVDSENPIEDLKTDKVYLILNFENENVRNYPIHVTLQYNSNSGISTAALSYVEILLQEKDSAVLRDELVSLAVDPTIMTHISVTKENLAVNNFLVTLVPTLLAMLLITGCSGMAVEVFAGEKERGNLERILATQAGRTDILLGKFAAILVMGLFSAVVSLFSYYFSMKLSPTVMETFGGADSLSLSAEIIGRILGAILSYAVFIASLLLLISLMSKSVKEAQSYVSLVSVLPGIIGLAAVLTPNNNPSYAMMLLPIYNTVINFKMILGDAVQPTFYHVTCISSIIYAILLLSIGSLLLKKERFITVS